MLRLALTLCLAVFACLSLAKPGYAKDAWGLAQATEIDPRIAGTTTLALGEGRGKIKALRIVTMGAPTTLIRVTVKPVDGEQVVTGGPVRLTDPQSPVTIYTAPGERVIATVALAWEANAAATGPVQLRIEALQSPEALAARPTGAVSAPERQRTGSPRSAQPIEQPARGGTLGGLPPPVASAPSPAETAPPPPVAAAPPPTRGFGATPPPAPAPAAPRPRTVREVADDPSGVCFKDNVCTPVPVFYGSSRNEVQTASNISFGFERPNKLTLGRTIVTIPKARKPGEIPRPTTLDWVRGVPSEGLPDKHFTIPKGGVKVYASEADFLAEAKKHIGEAGDSKDHAFIYVHGFAVSFENAMYRAAQISYDLGTGGKPFGTAFVYTWPSKGSILPTAYVYDGDSAEYAVPHLVKFIEIVTQKTGVKNVHLIAHSMGNRVLMRALEIAVSKGSPAWLSQVVMAAPDVDKQLFEQQAANVAGAARGLTLYASQSDNALFISRQIRGAGAPPRAGEVAPPAGPAVVTG
ncbi:MAG: alpha/beta hydrolase, partial [Hyphomicrobiaceae bacterium]|nr:alpha/beta hydrolase [Hyphomicrobiaceae bacterium]